MPRQLTDRQRLFCENLNRGMSAAEAARQAGYSSQYAERQAHQLMDKSPSVREYLESLRTDSRDDSVADGIKRRQVLTEILQGTLEAPYVAGFNLVDGKPDHAARIKAAELLAKMDGDLAPVKIEVSARIQVKAQDWVGRVLSTVASVLGDEAAEKLLPHLPVLELEA